MRDYIAEEARPILTSSLLLQTLPSSIQAMLNLPTTRVGTNTFVGLGKEERALIGSWDYLNRLGSTNYSNYLGDCEPDACGLSAVKAIAMA